MSSLHGGYANLLCIVPILVYVLPKWAWKHTLNIFFLFLKEDQGYVFWMYFITSKLTNYLLPTSSARYCAGKMKWKDRCSSFSNGAFMLAEETDKKPQFSIVRAGIKKYRMLWWAPNLKDWLHHGDSIQLAQNISSGFTYLSTNILKNYVFRF